MANHGPVNAFLLVGGRDISSDSYTLEETIENVIEERHGLGESWERHTAVGLAKIALDAGGGLYDDRVAGINEALQAKGETRQIVGYGFMGTAIGADVVLIDGDYAVNWKRSMQRDGLTKAAATHRITGAYYRGVVLHGLITEVAVGDNTATPFNQLNAPRLLPVTIETNTVANPTLVTTVGVHGLVTGDVIVVSGSNSTPTLNGTRTVTVTGPTTFTVPVNVTVPGSAGTFVKVTSTNAVVDAHVLSRGTDLTLTALHSADNVTYTPLGDISAAANTAVRLTFVGQVQQYNAVSWDVGEVPQPAEFYVAISR